MLWRWGPGLLFFTMARDSSVKRLRSPRWESLRFFPQPDKKFTFPAAAAAVTLSTKNLYRKEGGG